VSRTIQFASIKAAKDYLVERIAAEADRQAVPLSKLEREMLYFTEDGGLSRQMEEVNEAFERGYDNDAYEAKIAGLAQTIQSNNTSQEQERWNHAVLKLREGDHYLLVLIDAAAPRIRLFSVPKSLQPWLPALEPPKQRPPSDLLRLVVAAVIGGLILMALEALIHR
jgi:hypothetical protein